MGHYRKKPVIVEAERFDGTNAPRIAEMFGWKYTGEEEPADALIVETLNGDVTAEIGDWVIKGVVGEPYPCRNDVFEATYEPVPSEDP
jgi:hypothetical protein